MFCSHLVRGRKALVLLAAGLFSFTAAAVEYPIGTPQQKNGMELAAVYLQPVTMEPDGMMKKAEESDIHIEADIHALANNPNGFPEGAWMP
ncbi:MAG TPA: iron transporter, partial [Rhodocyclaceae bacterium]